MVKTVKTKNRSQSKSALHSLPLQSYPCLHGIEGEGKSQNCRNVPAQVSPLPALVCRITWNKINFNFILLSSSNNTWLLRLLCPIPRFLEQFKAETASTAAHKEPLWKDKHKTGVRPKIPLTAPSGRRGHRHMVQWREPRGWAPWGPFHIHWMTSGLWTHVTY